MRVFGAQLISEIFINLQKRVIKIISMSSFDAHANLFFGGGGGGGGGLTNFKILEHIKLQIGKVMYLYK